MYKSSSQKRLLNSDINAVYSFLKGRKMFIKDGFNLSKSREIKGGSPQGTKLGNILFCITVEDIELGGAEKRRKS